MSSLCLQCGAEIPSYKNNKKYCSEDCYHKSTIDKPNHKLRRRIIKVCPICGNEFETGGRAGSIDQIYCSISCMNYSRRKSLDDGIIANRTNWKELSLQMKGEYNYTCQLCNKQFEGGKQLLNVHHIIPRREGGSSDKSNLIVLCTSCHTVIERLTLIGYNQGNGFSPQKLTEDIKSLLFN